MKQGERTVGQLAAAGVACALLLGVGAVLVWGAELNLAGARASLAAARTARAQTEERLLRISDEEREVSEKLAVYHRLRSLGILGEERRLDWVEALGQLRRRLALPGLHYKVERRSLLASTSGKNAPVDAYSSMLKLDLSLLHEGDLLRALSALRESGNAYYSVKHCRIERVTPLPSGRSIAPRLHAECEIDLITLVDRAARS